MYTRRAPNGAPLAYFFAGHDDCCRGAVRSDDLPSGMAAGALARCSCLQPERAGNAGVELARRLVQRRRATRDALGRQCLHLEGDPLAAGDFFWDAAAGVMLAIKKKPFQTAG